MNEDEIREVVKKHREAGIPLDSIYLDIDYMVKYKDFTVNEETFPDLAGFAKEDEGAGNPSGADNRRGCENRRGL